MVIGRGNEEVTKLFLKAGTAIVAECWESAAKYKQLGTFKLLFEYGKRFAFPPPPNPK